MKRKDVTQLCADFLRSYFNKQYGIKLKSGHAHEIVAAFFGFKSRIAMLAQASHVISTWDQAEFALSPPPISLLDERLQNLLGSQPELPSSQVSAEIVYSVLVAQLYLRRDLRRFFKSGIPPIKWEVAVKREERDNETLFTVDVGQPVESSERLNRYRQYVIQLPRIAGKFDYGVPEVTPVMFSGLARTLSDEELNKMYPPPLHTIRNNRDIGW